MGGREKGEGLGLELGVHCSQETMSLGEELEQGERAEQPRFGVGRD